MAIKTVRHSVVAWVVISFTGSPAFGQDYVPGEVIVKLRQQTSVQASYIFVGKATSSKNMVLQDNFPRLNMYHFRLKSGQSVEAAVRDLSADPDVEYAEPNYILRKATSTLGISERLSAEEVEQLVAERQSQYLATDAPIRAVEAWSNLPSPPPRPVVAVIDTGVDVNHLVFRESQAIWTNPREIPGNGHDDDGNGYVDDVNGWNFVTNSSQMLDDDGHGTHVAGIILGVGQDIYSRPFSQSRIQIMPLKFLDGNGVGKTSDAIKAINYAIKNGAQILNNSWGGPAYSTALREAVAYSYSAGSVFVAAAGNSGLNNDESPMYPANLDLPHVISVAASDDIDRLASFSNFGSGSVHLASPGVYILSTLPGGGYGSSSGTSMAAPFVAGLAALTKLRRPDMLGFQIREVVMSGVDEVGGLAEKVAAHGRLNVATTMSLAATVPLKGNMPGVPNGVEDRALASDLASGGGCGLVAKLYNDFNQGQRQGPPPPSTSMVVLILLLSALPVVVWLILRLRQSAPEQRRRHERFMVNTSVTVKAGSRELVGQISSLSLGGVQLNTEALLEQGGVVNMSITSPDGKGVIEVEGRIVWSEANAAYGVQFEHASDDALSRISGWTRLLRKAS